MLKKSPQALSRKRERAPIAQPKGNLWILKNIESVQLKKKKKKAPTLFGRILGFTDNFEDRFSIIEIERALDMRVIDWGFSFVSSKSNHVTLDEGDEDQDNDDKDLFNTYLFCAYNA